jgi:hypothetical protein
MGKSSDVDISLGENPTLEESRAYLSRVDRAISSGAITGEDLAEIKPLFDSMLIATTQSKINQGTYRRFRLDEPAKTESVSNCIAPLIFDQDGYFFGHFTPNYNGYFLLEKGFDNMMAELTQLYARDFTKISSVHFMGGTLLTAESFPDVFKDGFIAAQVAGVNKLTALARKSIETLVEEWGLSNSDKVHIGWLDSDRRADVGYCECNGEYRVVASERPYPAKTWATNPALFAMLKNAPGQSPF